MRVAKFRFIYFGLLLCSVYACTGLLRIVSSSIPTVSKETCDAQGSCEDFDECPNCHENARCIYRKGHYICQCTAGYTGDGKTCTDINECSGQVCDVNCTNTDGSYQCGCNLGYILAPDGHSCIKDVCIPNPCKKTLRSRCLKDNQDPNEYQCFCQNNRIGDNCEFEGPCVTEKPCINGHCVQVDDVGKYRCDCFNHVGFYCEFDDPCVSNSCHHGGTCKADPRTGRFTCDCDGTGYIGPTCNRQDKCASYPCKNKGLCAMDSFDDIVCICQDGYTGKRCEEKVSSCTPNPCHGGDCHIYDGIAKCSCNENYTGEYCEIKVTCADYPCKHDGVCTATKDGLYSCSCGAGYRGSNCEIIELPCGQDILTDLEGEDSSDVDSQPIKKYYCPVVQTIGERGGCYKCFASAENCRGCCAEEEERCKANCGRLEQFCQDCEAGQPNFEQCKAAKLNCSAANCTQICTDTATNCKNGCGTNVPPVVAIGPSTEYRECPNVYICPKEPSNETGADSKNAYQCQALKYPSGKIECDYKKVDLSKEEYHSYIMFPRINFAGKVQIDSATLNNVFDNFDISTFTAENEKISQENWNPSGSSNFRLADVTVVRVCGKDGSCVYQSHNDPLVGAPVKDKASGKVSAKIVDLDIEVQGRLSEIYGLSIDVGGYFKADMETASFQSLWYKMIDVSNDDYGQGSRFQSVLTNVQFSEKHNKESKIVEYFKKNIGPNRQLSICFNIDLMGEHPAFNYSFARIVGSIGFSGEKAPHFFNYGRLLRRLPATREFSHAPFTVDEKTNKIYIDLGNSLAIGRNGDVLNSVGQLALGFYAGAGKKGVDTPNCLDNITLISRIYYNEYGGYKFTAGIKVIDIPTHLRSKLDKQFVLAKINDGEDCLSIVLAENKEGINVRPNNSSLVYRVQYGQVIHGNFFVTIFGKPPNSDQDINLKLESADSIIRNHPVGPVQPFGLFKDKDNLSIYNFYFYAAIDTANIRKIIDGQVYALQYTFNGYPLNPDRNEAMNTAICVHVYDEITPNDQPTWVIDILPIFKLYANLFPVMRSFVNLGAYNVVVEKKCHILTAMSLDFQDPQFMPVTRDLSPKKTEMILKWLDDDQPDYGLTNHAQLLTKQHLLNMLQTALELEHATIPIYFNGFLSMKPWQNEEVKRMLHQIIVDEMFHFAQVANIINALGGRPFVLGKTFVPAYPSHLPGGCRPNMIATINKISNQQVHDVYMEIEEPSYVLKDHELVTLINKISSSHLNIQMGNESSVDYNQKCAEALKLFPLPDKELTEKNHQTIGELYMAVVYILGELSICGDKEIFTGKTKQLMWADPERLRVVNNYDDALKAIKAIVDQGEGASVYNPLQQNVNSSELAHYFKFSTIFHGKEIKIFDETLEKVFNSKAKEIHQSYSYVGDKIPFFETGVWPVVDNPQMSKYKIDSQAYKNAQAFNDVYRTLLETLQSVFDGNVDRFDDAFGLMKSLMVYGTRVVQTPIDEEGDPNIGPNAGPTYFN